MLYNVYGLMLYSALLVLDGTSLSSINALLALSRRSEEFRHKTQYLHFDKFGIFAIEAAEIIRKNNGEKRRKY